MATPDFDQAFEDIVKAGISKAFPEVGGLITPLTDLFFPQAGPLTIDQIWDGIKARVEALVRNLIDENRVKGIRDELRGLEQHVTAYSEESIDSPQKGMYLTTVIGHILDIEPSFFDEQEPWKTITYFLSLGTIALSFYREEVLFFKPLFGKDDPDAAVHLKRLQDKIKAYSGAVTEMFDVCVQNRRHQVLRQEWDERNGMSTRHVGKIRDEGVDPPWETDVIVFGNPEHPGDLVLDVAYEDRMRLIETSWIPAFQHMTSVSDQWPAFDPTGPGPQPKPQRKIWEFQGPWGKGISPGEVSFSDKDMFEQYGPPTKIELWAWDRVDGIKLWYGGHETWFRGARNGSGRIYELKPGEQFKRVGGRCGDAIDSLTFGWRGFNGTPDGTISGGFHGGAGPAGQPDNFNADYWSPDNTSRDGQRINSFRLAYVEGKHGGDSIEQLSAAFYRWSDEDDD